MSNIDKQALRADALEATGGSWVRESGEGWEAICCDDDQGNAGFIIAEFQGENATANRKFVQSANPATVLALLDELEKMQAQSSKWCEAFHKAVSVGARYEERIAELERNEIREEGNQFLVVRHPGKLPVVKHCAGELEGFLRQLLEHDPMATIDIVTHRYYGVGGQWVQDADEYLQMMAAAAGKGE